LRIDVDHRAARERWDRRVAFDGTEVENVRCIRGEQSGTDVDHASIYDRQRGCPRDGDNSEANGRPVSRDRPSPDDVEPPARKSVLAARRFRVGGPLDDVLGRFAFALGACDDALPVVRLTADNVVPDGAFVAACVDAFVAGSSRVLHAGASGDGLPYGVNVQIARAGDLRAAAAHATDAADREHVFPWLVRQHGAAGFHPAGAPRFAESARATLDTLDDYLALRALFRDGDDPVGIGWVTLCERLAAAQPARVPQRRGEPVLWLGTAQLGLPSYGIANRVGRPDDDDARALLALAADAGCGIDTAHAYGDAEARLGRSLPRGSVVPVTTKLDPLEDVARDAPRSVVRRCVDASVYGSLVALRRERVDALLLHRYAHRHAWNGAAWERLCELRDAGWIGRLGASFDRPEDAAEALGDRDIAHIQVPFNALDRRWDGIVRDAAARGRIVHGRSVFLQGAIGSDAWPGLAGFDGDAWSQRLREATRAARRDDARAFAIAYALGEPALSAIVVGADSAAQFAETIARAFAAPLTARQRADADTLLAGAPEDLLVPSRWP
jgi:spore coat polysaccharide biosynthesis protein SpsF